MLKMWRFYWTLSRWASLDSRCMSRSLLPILVGLCLGMAVSMMYAPFSEDSCETYLANQDPQKMINLRNTKSVADPPPQDDISMFEPRLLVPRSADGRGSPANSGNPGNSPPEAHVKVETKGGAKFFRPKFAATELGIRQKLFVAVLSSRDTLNTLAVAINRTLAHYVTKTVFFIDQKSASLPSGMVIVNFADGYNHLLPVNVFKYVIKKYGRGYDYYLFTTDHAYVRAERVYDLVSQISVSKHVHMGAPKGQEGGKQYCALDAGIVLSQSMLVKVNSSLKWCSDNCHHLDQSLNFGKCLLYASGMPCQISVGKSEYETNQVKNFDFDKDIEQLKEKAEFNRSYAVFPMSSDTNHYKLHRYFCDVELNSTWHQIQAMKKEILYMSQFAPGGRDSISWPIGVPEQYKPKNRFDVIRWDYFTETHIFFQDDFTTVKELAGADKLDIQDIIKVSMEQLNEKHNNKFLYSYLINGYRRFDPQRGMEYVLDLALEDTSLPPVEDNYEVSYKDRIVEKRVFLVRPLGEVEIVPMPYVTESTRIHLVLPVHISDADNWGLFLETYAKLQAESGEGLALILIFMYNQLPKAEDSDVFSVLKSLVGFYNDKLESGIKTSTIKVATNNTYIPEYRIIDLVSEHLPDDALIMTCTMGMQLTQEMLNRVRINTVVGWQVFFPVGFWQFRPNLIYDKKPYPTEIEFNSKAGHYDVLSYEHGSFYNSDYKEARRSLTVEQLWSCDIYEMFVKQGTLHVLRAVEPEFKHFYMQLECLPSSPSILYERCMERKALGLATRAQLAKRIFYYQSKRNLPQEDNAHR